MKVVVTGGNGYVGRIVCTLLCDSHDVTVIDSLRYGKNRFSSELLDKVTMKELDIRDGEKVSELLAEIEPDVVIHLAAIHFIPECEEQPDLAIATNIEGTANLLRCITQDCRFVFASSAAVYAPEEVAHSEGSSPVAPMDVYGITKLTGEYLVDYYAKKNGFSAVSVRLFNVIGAGETNPHVLPEIIAQLKSGATSIFLGNMTPQRDYIDVRDAAAGFVAAALSGNPSSGAMDIVNLGLCESHSVKQLVDLIAESSGLEISVETDPDRVRAVDRPMLLANNEKIRSGFDWNPRYKIRDTIRDMWEEPDLPESIKKKYSGV